MNNNGQFSAIGIFFQVLVALFFLASGFGENINFWVQRLIAAEGLSGLQAFLWAYMNLWIILALMIVTAIGTATFTNNTMEGE